MENKKAIDDKKPNNQEQVDYDYPINGVNGDSYLIFSIMYALATWLMLTPAFKNIKWIPSWLKCLISIIISTIMIFLVFALIISIWEFIHKWVL